MPLTLGVREGPSSFGGTNACWSGGDGVLGGVACRGVETVFTVGSDGTDSAFLVLDRDDFDTM